MKPGFQWKSILTVMALGWLFMLTPSASASSVDDVVDMIVKHVVKYLEDQGKKELFIDQFKGPRTSGGRLLETKVREKLKASGVEIKADDLEASWTLEGKLSTDTSGRSAIVAVRIELFDNGRNSMAEFTKRFRSDPSQGRASPRQSVFCERQRSRLLPESGERATLKPFTPGWKRFDRMERPAS